MDNQLNLQSFSLKEYLSGIKVVFFDAEGTLFQYEGNPSIDSSKTTHFPKRLLEPQIPELLNELYARGYKIGTMSNFYHPIVPVLRDLKIDQYIEFPFCFNNLQLRKPSLESYRKAMELCEFPSHEILMIGDNLESDYYPAEKVGWKSLLYSSSQHSTDSVFQNEQNIRKFHSYRQIIEIL